MTVPGPGSSDEEPSGLAVDETPDKDAHGEQEQGAEGPSTSPRRAAQPPPLPSGTSSTVSAVAPTVIGVSSTPAPDADADADSGARIPTMMVMASYQPPEGTSPELAIEQARSEATVTGVGVVQGVPIAMVGRQSELECLVESYKDAARERGPRVVTITGARGTGKTRLVLELLETLRLSDYPFALMTCFGGAKGAEAHRDVLQRLLAWRMRLPGPEQPVGDRVTALKRRVRELFDAKDVAWAQHVLSASYELPAPALMLREVQALRTDRSALRLAMRELVERLVRHQARACPVVLWFDELQYDDADGLIELCEMLVRLEGSPVLAVLGGEGSEVVPGERLERGGVAVAALELGRLPAQASEELVRETLRMVEEPPEQLISMIVRKGQGVPLAIEQIVRLLIDHGVIVVPGGEGAPWQVHLDRLFEAEALPSSVEDLARLRIEALAPDRRRLLEVAAMLGQSFSVEDLVRVMRLEPMDYDEVPWFNDARSSWAQQLLLELMGREIVALVRDEARAVSHTLASSSLRGGEEGAASRQDGAQANTATLFEFRFPSEQRFLVEQADPDLARSVHGCHARMLALHGAEPSRVAMHLEAAGLYKEAARRWIEVGEAAERAFFNHSALDALTHALEFLGPEDGEQYMDLLQAVGRIAVRVGQTSVAEATVRTLVQTTFAFEDRRRAVRAYRGLGEAQFAAAQYVRAETSYRRMLDLAERDEAEHAIAAALDGVALSMYEVGAAGACAEAIKLLERALELRRAVGDSRGTADTLDAIGGVCVGRGDLNRSMACFTEAINARRAVDDWSGLARALGAMAVTCARLGRIDLAQRHVEEALEVAERTGELAVRLRALNTLAQLALQQSATEAAADHLAGAIALVEQISDRGSQILCLHTRAQLRAGTGDLPGAWEDAGLALQAAEEGDSARQLGIALRTLAVIQATMIRERVQPRPSITQTRDRFLEAQRLLEEMGNWHELAATLRAYGEFLRERGKEVEAKRCLTRAEALDPLTVLARD